MKKTVCFLSILCLSSCTIYRSDGSTFRTEKRYCDQAFSQGWCSDMCGDHQPEHCYPLTDVKCSDGMCVGVGKHGSVFFLWRG